MRPPVHPSISSHSSRYFWQSIMSILGQYLLLRWGRHKNCSRWTQLIKWGGGAWGVGNKGSRYKRLCKMRHAFRVYCSDNLPESWLVVVSLFRSQCFALPRQAWRQVIYVGGMTVSVGLGGIQFKDLESECMWQPWRLLQHRTLTWNKHLKRNDHTISAKF